MGYRDDFSTRTYHRGCRSHVEPQPPRKRNRAQLRASLGGYLLPRNQVAVMVKYGDYNLVARREPRPCIRVCDKIDGFGGVANENYFARIGSADKVSGT